MAAKHLLGEHYRAVPGGEEHHKRVTRLKLNWYAANITKYAERASFKGVEKEDVVKIIKYAQLWHDSLTNDGSEPDRSYTSQGD